MAKYNQQAPLLIAHRGGAGYFLENTLEAVANAVAKAAVNKCAGAELDLHLSKDGYPVIHHNPTLNWAYTQTPQGRWLTPTDNYPLNQLTLAELQQFKLGTPNPTNNYQERYPLLQPTVSHLPSLQEIIRLVKAEQKINKQLDFKLVLEIKPLAKEDWQPLVIATLELLAAENFTNFVFCSFNWPALVFAQQQQAKLKKQLETQLKAQSEVKPVVKIETWFTSLPLAWFRGEELADIQLAEEDKDLLATNSHPKTAEELIKQLKEFNADYWFAFHNDCTAKNLNLAKAAGLKLAAWTTNQTSPEAIAKLKNLGLSAICVDYFYY